MASGSKERSVFTGNSIGGRPGESDGLKRKKIMDGNATLLSAYPQDNVHGLDLPDCYGGDFGGGDMSLSHSLTGVSANQSVAPRSGKSGKKEI
jgi:hypothetical protein